MLGNLDPENEEQGVYIGVTATPARLDLNNTYLNDSRNGFFLIATKTIRVVHFFPLTEEDRRLSDYRLVKLPDEGDDPKLLRHTVFVFITGFSTKYLSLCGVNSIFDAYSYSWSGK